MMITFELKPSPHIIAGNYLRAALNEQHRTRIRSYVSHLDILAGAAEAAVPQVLADVGRPHGTPGYAAFDLFVYRLLLAAQHSGGKLTIYKSAHRPNGWDGSLLRLVNVLRPELPKGFLPRSLGNPLDRVAKQFRSDTRKNGV